MKDLQKGKKMKPPFKRQNVKISTAYFESDDEIMGCFLSFLHLLLLNFEY